MKHFRILIAWIIPIAMVTAQTPDHLQMKLQFSGDSLYAEVDYVARPQVPSDSLFFIFNPGFALDTIKGADLKGYTPGQRADRPFPGKILFFEEGLQAGKEARITFVYSMDLRASNHLDSGWIELNVDKLWFPIRGDLGALITYEVDISGFPEEFDLVSHMDARLEKQGGQIRILQPNPVQEVLLLGGRDMQMRQLSDSISFFASKKIPDTLLQSMHTKVRNSIDFLNGTVGASDPISQFRVVLRNTPRSELGYQFNRGSMIVTGTDFDDYGNLSHEIAHFWWAGADFISEPWMNESFANYFMFLVLEQFDPESYTSLVGKYREIASKAPPVATATLFSEGSYQAYYHKGAVLLLDLETGIGKPEMYRLQNKMVSKDIHDTEGFLDALEELTRDEVRKDFEAALNE